MRFFSLLLWIDEDRDGLPSTWENENGLSDSNPADASVDADADGFTNAQEYLTGTNPRDAQSLLKAEQWAVQPVPGTNGHEFTISWASVSGRAYVVERSFDLVQWTAVAEGVQATPPLNTVANTVENSGGKVFYRIRLQ